MFMTSDSFECFIMEPSDYAIVTYPVKKTKLLRDDKHMFIIMNVHHSTFTRLHRNFKLVMNNIDKIFIFLFYTYNSFF